MNVLFDTRHSDTASSAIEHGKRVASALLDRWFGTRFFASLGRDHSTAFYQVTPTHVRAKSCPMRPMAHQNIKNLQPLNEMHGSVMLYVLLSNVKHQKLFSVHWDIGLQKILMCMLHL